MSVGSPSPKKASAFFFAGLVCILLMGLLWFLDGFFVYLIFGVASYCFFLAFWYWPINAAKEASRTGTKRGRPKKIKIPSAAVFISTFIALGILLVIAVVHFFEATTVTRYEADVAYQNAYDFEVNGQPDSAKLWYQKALSENPEHNNALIGLGNLFLNEQLYDSAWEYYDRAVKANPSDDNAHYNKAIVRYYQGRYDESSHEAKAILERNADYHDAEVLIGDNCNARNKPDSALYWYQKAYDAGYRNAIFLHVMAYTHDVKGNIPAAIEFYKHTLEYDSGQTDVYVRLSELLGGIEGERFRELGRRIELH